MSWLWAQTCPVYPILDTIRIFPNKLKNKGANPDSVRDE